MGLKAFVAPVQEYMVKLMNENGDPRAPSFDLGWKAALQRFEALPRLVWVPRGGPTVGDAIDGDDRTTPRKLATRKPVLDVHIRGTDIDDCEVLANFLICALQDVVGGSYRVVSEDWGVGEENEDTHDSQLMVLGVELRLPWTRQMTPRTRVGIQFPITPADPIAVT